MAEEGAMGDDAPADADVFVDGIGMIRFCFSLSLSFSKEWTLSLPISK